jgi:PiT family inorganic phosphate transporter
LLDEKLKRSSPGRIGGIVFGLMLLGGVFYIVNRLSNDLSIVHTTSIFPISCWASRC